MKNLHLIPTDKPSRLRYNLSNVLVFTKELYRDYGKEVNQNIYITSDEEVKEGDYFLYDGTKIRYKSNGTEYHGRDLCHISGNHRYPVSESKKIILTTDQDLIKDGVQAIDDIFLEWFVENPSCEKVDLDTFSMGDKVLYNVVFPQEEPKQETLEEADKNYSIYNEQINKAVQEAVKFGAEWQAERMYSEEEVIDLLIKMNSWPTTFEGIEDVTEWFEQFKNKGGDK